MELQGLGEEECLEIASSLRKAHVAHLRGRNFCVKFSESDDTVLATVILSNADESYFLPVEGRMKYKAEEMTKKQASVFLIDYIALFFEEFFAEKESLNLTIDWADFTWDATDFQLKAQLLNRRLEKMADDWLSSSDSSGATLRPESL